MRDSGKALLVTLSLAAAACGSSSGGKDINKFVGVWGAPTGTFTETCPSNPAAGGTSQVTDPETWTLGSTSDLVQTIPGTGCVFHADVSANTATGSPSGQTCTINTAATATSDALTDVLTFTTYNFVVSPDGLTATENFAGTDMETDNTAGLTGNCSFTQNASYTKQ